MSDERFETLLGELSDELDPRQREELAARLALSVEPIDPGPEVRARVMEGVDYRQARRRASGRRLRRSAGGLAAAAAAGAALSFWLLSATRESAPTPTPATSESAAARVGELESLLSEQDEELVALERELADARDATSVLLADRLERLDLAPVADVAATGRVYWDWDAYSCYFVADGLPILAAGHTYVLWLYTESGEVLRAGSFAAPGGRRASFFAMLPKDLGHVVSAVVTDEPDPPGEQPAGDALLAGGEARG